MTLPWSGPKVTANQHQQVVRSGGYTTWDLLGVSDGYVKQLTLWNCYWVDVDVPLENTNKAELYMYIDD